MLSLQGNETVTNFTAIFLDQNAREIRQTTVDVIKRFKQTSAVQAEHMMSEKFVAVYRECRAASLWEICYRCVGRMHKNDEDFFVESWTTVVRTGEDGTQWTERRPFQYTSQWRNYSYQSKYAETPANVSSSMRRYARKASDFLDKRERQSSCRHRR